MSVYFMQAGPGGPIKIGFAVDVGRRKSQIQSANAAKINVLAIIPGGESEESALHDKFSHIHIRGEWFLPGRDLTQFIANCVAENSQASRINTESQPSTQSEIIFCLFGGEDDLLVAVSTVSSKAISASTVAEWRETGFIPADWWPVLMDAARASGKRIVPSDFVEHLHMGSSNDRTP